MNYTKSEVQEALKVFNTRIDYIVLYDNNIVYETYINENEQHITLFMNYDEPEIKFSELDPSEFQFYKNIDIEVSNIHELSKVIKKSYNKNIVFEDNDVFVDVEEIEDFSFFEDHDMYNLKIYERKELNDKALLREIKKVQNGR